MTKENLPSPDQIRQIALEVNRLLVELITDPKYSGFFDGLKQEDRHIIIFAEIDGREAYVLSVDGYRRVRLQHQRHDGEERTANYTLEKVSPNRVLSEYRPFIIDGKLLRNEGGDYAFNPISFNEDSSHPFAALFLDYWGRFKRGQLTAANIIRNLDRKIVVPSGYFPKN